MKRSKHAVLDYVEKLQQSLIQLVLNIFGTIICVVLKQRMRKYLHTLDPRHKIKSTAVETKHRAKQND